MSFAGMNYPAIVVAAVAAWIFGAVYYAGLGTRWMKAARIDPSAAKMGAGLFVTSFVCELIMAWVMAGVIGHLGPGQVTLWNGVVSALFLWLGFIATTTTVNQRYQGFGWELTILDGLHWLGVAVIMGAVIGGWGV